jgi:hypothetical protein
MSKSNNNSFIKTSRTAIQVRQPPKKNFEIEFQKEGNHPGTTTKNNSFSRTTDTTAVTDSSSSRSSRNAIAKTTATIQGSKSDDGVMNVYKNESIEPESSHFHGTTTPCFQNQTETAVVMTSGMSSRISRSNNDGNDVIVSTPTRTKIENSTTSPSLQPPPLPQQPQPQDMVQNNTFEKHFFQSLRPHVNNLSIQEFKESWAFATTIQSYYAKDVNNADIQIILDATGGGGDNGDGGGGTLGALLLTLLPSTKRCVVIDPVATTKIINSGVELAWNTFYNQGSITTTITNNNKDDDKTKKSFEYRHEECLKSGIQKEIKHALFVDEITPQQILVIASCRHACQHLSSDETLEMLCSYGVHCTVMPCSCCHEQYLRADDDGLSSFQDLNKELNLNMDIGIFMDMLLAGKVMSWNNNGKQGSVKYQVKIQLIDENTTPQNRMILCKAKNLDGTSIDFDEDEGTKKVEFVAHERLTRAYHKVCRVTKNGIVQFYVTMKSSLCVKSAGIGLITGVVICVTFRRRK